MYHTRIMRRSRLELLKNCLKAFPVLTTGIGAVFGYYEGHELGHDVMAAVKGLPARDPEYVMQWYEILENVIIAGLLGLTGGVAMTCFGMAFTHHIPIEEDPIDYAARGKDGKFVPVHLRTYFKKQDVEDHKKSITKVAEKYEKKKQEQAAEAQEILKIGTSGIREKKFGKKIVKKSAPVKKTGR